MITYLEVISAVENFLSSPFSFDSSKIISKPNIDRIIFPYKQYKVNLDKSFQTDRPGWTPFTNEGMFIPLKGKFNISLGNKEGPTTVLSLEAPSFLEVISPLVWYGISPQKENNLSIFVVGGKFERCELVPPPLSKGVLSNQEEQDLLNEFHEAIFSNSESFQIL